MRTAQFIAMSLGVVVLGSILNGGYRGGLEGHLAGLPAGAQAAAREGLGGASAVPHVFGAARDAYTNGMSDVLLVSAALLLVAAVLVALFLPARADRRSEREPAATWPAIAGHSKDRTQGRATPPASQSDLGARAWRVARRRNRPRRQSPPTRH